MFASKQIMRWLCYNMKKTVLDQNRQCSVNGRICPRLKQSVKAWMWRLWHYGINTEAELKKLISTMNNTKKLKWEELLELFVIRSKSTRTCTRLFKMLRWCTTSWRKCFATICLTFQLCQQRETITDWSRSLLTRATFLSRCSRWTRLTNRTTIKWGCSKSTLRRISPLSPKLGTHGSSIPKK